MKGKKQRIRIITLLLWCMYIFLSFLGKGCSNSDEKIFKQGQNAYEIGDFETAINLFSSIIKAYPDSQYVEESIYYSAEIYNLYTYDAENAIRLYSHLLFSFPDSTFACDARKKIADIYFDRFDEFERAIESYQKFTVQCPDKDSVAYSQRRIGDCYFKKGQYNQALIEYSVVEEKYSESNQMIPALMKIAQCSFIQGDMMKAEKYFRKALDRGPQPPLNHEIKLNLIQVLLNQKDYCIALTLSKELVEQYPRREDIIKTHKKVLQLCDGKKNASKSESGEMNK